MLFSCSSSNTNTSDGPGRFKSLSLMADLNGGQLPEIVLPGWPR